MLGDHFGKEVLAFTLTSALFLVLGALSCWWIIKVIIPLSKVFTMISALILLGSAYVIWFMVFPWILKKLDG